MLAKPTIPASELFLAWDKDLFPQFNSEFRRINDEVGTGRISVHEGLQQLANGRDGALTLADRHQPSEPLWRLMADWLDDLLGEAFYELLGQTRRYAVRQLLKGRWTAEEGRRFLEWVDLEHRAGRCTLEEFGEFVVALDQAELRPAS